jgi:FCP1-like phosphatase family protein
MKDKDENNNLEKDIDYSSDNFIKINLNKPEIEKIKILKKEKIAFKKDDIIAKYKIKEKENINSVKSPIYGWIVKYEENEKLLILEECKHEMFYCDLCAKCGYKKTEKDELMTFGFMKNDFSYTKEKALSMEKTKVDDYLTAKKLILLLDLDNTILHCCSTLISGEKLKNLNEKYMEYISKIPIKNNINRYDSILIKFRPYLRTFFKNIKNKYEIFVYTQATKEYATSIIQYVNTNFEKDILSISRMIPRSLNEDGFAENKSIKNVFPTQEKMILIIDDNKDVWKESGNNFIYIYPYRFFSERDKSTDKLMFINNNFEKIFTKESFYKIECDNVLFCITNLLLNVHRKFFQFYEKYSIIKSISRITNDTLKLILSKKKFYYYINFDKYPKKNKKKEKKEIEDNINNDLKEETQKDTEINNNLEEISKDLNNGNNNIDDDKKENDIVLKDKNNEEKNNQIKNNVKKNLKFKIQKLGGELIEEEKDMFNADFFLTDFYEENNPIFKNIENYKEKKIPILHCHYIEICLMYFFNVKIEDFILNENNKYLKFLDLNQVFEKNKGDIVNFYGNNEFIDEN